MPSIVDMTEKEIGARFCNSCNKMVSLDLFMPGKRRYQSAEHFRGIRRKLAVGTADRRLYNSIRSRAYQDMRLFGQTSMGLGVKHIRELLTPEQMADYTAHCIIPRDPTVPMTRENAVAVTTAQRRYVDMKAEEGRGGLPHRAGVHFGVSCCLMKLRRLRLCQHAAGAVIASARCGSCGCFSARRQLHRAMVAAAASARRSSCDCFSALRPLR
jgi:hypothetical protein